MAFEALQNFGAELKSLREDKGISLIQISNRTKIDIKFLSALEASKFDILPDLYVRSFIKEYLQTIDVNPKILMEKYDLLKSGKEETVNKEVQSKFSFQSEAPIEEHKTKFNENEYDSTTTPKYEEKTKKVSLSKIKLNYIVGGLILFVAAVISYFAFFQNSSNNIIANEEVTANSSYNEPRYEVEQTPMPDQQNPFTNQSEQNQPVVPNTPAPQFLVGIDSLQLSVQTSKQVWVKVYQDGKVVYQQLVDKGTNIKYHAKKSFAVSVGNAGAVKIFFNNKLVPNVGKEGESRNIYLALEGFRYYTISSNEKKTNPTN